MPFVPETKAETMKRTHLLAPIIAAAMPFAAVLAEDTTKPEAADQTKEQNSCCKGMMGMNMGKMTGMSMGNMMSEWKDQEAELDKLVADMNSAPPDKKIDAIAAVVSKLVEQRKAMHERMQKMMKMGQMILRLWLRPATRIRRTVCAFSVVCPANAARLMPRRVAMKA